MLRYGKTVPVSTLFYLTSRARAIGVLCVLFCIVGIAGFFGYTRWLGAVKFDASTHGLPDAVESAPRVMLKDGDEFDLRASYVKKQIGDRTVRMIAYNGSVPGPFLSVPQGGTITIHFTNELDIETTVHSHGIRLDFPYDGTPHLSQQPVGPGETFTYIVKFPDGGMYWYHPHIREDYAQEMGAYGVYAVEPILYKLPPVNEELDVTIDDILFEDDAVAAFYKAFTNYAVMGRFGNVMLVNGVRDFKRTFHKGDVIRFSIANTANARPFELTIPNAKMKLVGSDLSPYERETFIDSLLIAPAERYIIDVYFPEAGVYTLTHTSHDRALGEMWYTLATFTVDDKPRESMRTSFMTLHTYAWVTDDAQSFSSYLYKRPDKTLRIDLDPGAFDLGQGMENMPCHRMPDGEWMGACTDEAKTAWLNGETVTAGPYEKIHWEDHLGTVNQKSTSDDIVWKLEDQGSLKVNDHIDDWKFRVGDVIKMRIYNDPNSPHPMQHPIHMHGQRMMLLSINGTEVSNKVWKDTILVPVGDTYDIMVEFSNPGLWMVHCHIAEHLSSGMMFTFAVGEEYFDQYDAMVRSGAHGSHTSGQ